ncbi:GTP-binding protein OBGC, chloroplastic, partial [Tanacetum coccineum]
MKEEEEVREKEKGCTVESLKEWCGCVPSGGDRGHGANVYLQVDEAMNSLLPFKNSIHFRAGIESHGQGSKMNVDKGEYVVKVPPETAVRVVRKDGVIGDVLLKLLYNGDKALLLSGGR